MAGLLGASENYLTEYPGRAAELIPRREGNLVFVIRRLDGDAPEGSGLKSCCAAVLTVDSEQHPLN